MFLCYSLDLKCTFYTHIYAVENGGMTRYPNLLIIPNTQNSVPSPSFQPNQPSFCFFFFFIFFFILYICVPIYNKHTYYTVYIYLYSPSNLRVVLCSFCLYKFKINEFNEKFLFLGQTQKRKIRKTQSSSFILSEL